MRVGSVVPPETVVISSVDVNIVTVFVGFSNCSTMCGKKLYSSDSEVTLDDIRTEFAGFDLITVICEELTHGDIYQYGNRGTDEWYCIGKTIGYA